jgi:hypothetical protein
MTVEIAAKDHIAVPITWDVTQVEGEVAELWADNPADDEPLAFKKKILNDGSAHVNFPVGYVGDSALEIRGENDSLDEGVISVGSEPGDDALTDPTDE